MANTPWYKEWFNSPFYHKLYFERNEQEAKSFIQHLINHLNPVAGSRILEVACGKGRNSKMLASFGFDVTGFDLFPDSIAWAKQFELEHLHFFIHDMRLPFYSNYFDYALNLFTSFGYFKTVREHNAAIRTISTSLRPGGYFIIDYLNVHYAEEHLVPHEIKEINGTRYEIHCWDNDTHFYKRITITDPSLPKPQQFIEEVTKFSLGDFTDMLAYQGLQVQEVFGDYKLEKYDIKKTPRLIIIAKKKLH
jgi:SAM-dependent methyltransferase